jgi:hypothetical protein
MEIRTMVCLCVGRMMCWSEWVMTRRIRSLAATRPSNPPHPTK